MNLEELYSYAKKFGFVFPSAEIYGGFSGFYDFGPLGVELKRNIESLLWKRFVTQKNFVVGIDGSIITHPEVWNASGHTKNFSDPVLKCEKCGARFKADSFIEDLNNGPVEDITEFVNSHDLKCPNCGGSLKFTGRANLMFETVVGTKDKSYLRPETAQLIFINFKQVLNSFKINVPFGIAQLGKSFRNEISPRDFLFRLREFNQFEIEFFVDPEEANNCPYFDGIKDKSIQILTREAQKEGGKAKTVKLKDLQDRATKWHLYWLWEFYSFFVELGIKPENLRLREHLEDELAHYAKACFDIEYKFPFGWKEIHGCAYRSDFDLKQHQSFSKTKMEVFDQAKNKRYIPHVIEPSQGIERAFLAFMFEAIEDDRLKLSKELSPIKVAILPVFNREPFLEIADKLFKEITNKGYSSMIDVRGPFVKRYDYHNKIGTYLTLTLDYQSLEDGSFVIRLRDKDEFIRTKDINQIFEMLS
ncbi:MAG: glycyl-tRNA synthetase [Candidatus Woesearchaeota archaeon]|nr:glycyl-tRNA synthetase [Candidatus Woesearchaeota archaeon]